MTGIKSATLRVDAVRHASEIGFGKVWVDPDICASLGIGNDGTYVSILGRKTAVATAVPGDYGDAGTGTVRIDGPTRTSAGASTGDTVTVRCIDPPPASSVVICPVGDNVEADRTFSEVFRSNVVGRGVIEGQDFIVPNISLMGTDITFTVASTSPSGPVVISESTAIRINREPHPQGEQGRESRKVTFDEIGGLDKELERIRMMIDWPLNRPELFAHLGITPPKGILLYGPPGTGKTLIAEAVANECCASFYNVRGPELVGRYVGWSEDNIRKLFDKANETAPSVIFFDEIDSIASKRDDTRDGVYRNILTQLMTCMDGMGSKSNVVIIGATNRPDDLDPAIRRPGRFDREIEIGIPNLKGRRDILGIRTCGRGMPLADNVDLDRLAKMTQGFVGADLAALVKEAAMQAVARMVTEESIDLRREVPKETLRGMKVTMRDFDVALGSIRPSGMREISGEVPAVTWDQIGGLDRVRDEILEDLLPGTNREAFDRLGIEPGKGVLLYGPPGTGKTLIAKALANERGCNFIPVNGPELMGRFYGQTEEGIRKVFDRAKKMSPSIVFFDEIDSIAPIRGAGHGGAYDSMVAQLLTCLDGVSELSEVLVMAATNRPDMIDPAVLRPGRIDRMVLVGLPDKSARSSILKVHTSGMSVSDSVDLAHIADMTDGYVGADLAALCREAGLNAFHRGSDRIDGGDFKKAMEKVRPSCSAETVKRYEKMAEETMKTDRWNGPLYG